MGRTNKDSKNDWTRESVKIGRDRTRLRSSVFEDEIGKANRRCNRKNIDQKIVDEVLCEEEDYLDIED